MNFLLADIVEPVVCSVAGSSIFVGIVVRLLFVFRNIGRVKFYFSFLFIGLEYTCLHSQLLIDGHVHHWIMATRRFCLSFADLFVGLLALMAF